MSRPAFVVVGCFLPLFLFLLSRSRGFVGVFWGWRAHWLMFALFAREHAHLTRVSYRVLSACAIVLVAARVDAALPVLRVRLL